MDLVLRAVDPDMEGFFVPPGAVFGMRLDIAYDTSHG